MWYLFLSSVCPRKKERDNRLTWENLGMIVDLPVKEKRHVLLHSASPQTINTRHFSLEYSIAEQTYGDIDEVDNPMRFLVNA